jgi:dynein heavy chain 1, cytosolic
LFNTEALKQTQTQILDLEKTLQDYKKDYAQLIVEVQMIKQEMEAVQHKVKRSTELLRNLGSEKLRWTSASESSNNKVPTILGDSILAAGFLAYLGFLESTDRT